MFLSDLWGIFRMFLELIGALCESLSKSFFWNNLKSLKS